MKDLTAEQQAELDHAYGYHAPTTDQIALYGAINEAGKNFEAAVLRACPPSADRTFAQRQIRDARMTANRSIALHRPEAVREGVELRPRSGPEFGVGTASKLG